MRLIDQLRAHLPRRTTWALIVAFVAVLVLYLFVRPDDVASPGVVVPAQTITPTPQRHVTHTPSPRPSRSAQPTRRPSPSATPHPSSRPTPSPTHAPSHAPSPAPSSSSSPSFQPSTPPPATQDPTGDSSPGALGTASPSALVRE